MAGRKEMFGLLPISGKFALRSNTQGASKSCVCDRDPFCCTWQLLPILSRRGRGMVGQDGLRADADAW